uniref:Uncharacterized protein n=1 Tax=Arundo donax TaxID=35708 RepID=A0A0A9BQ42_ARUDO
MASLRRHANARRRTTGTAVAAIIQQGGHVVHPDLPGDAAGGEEAAGGVKIDVADGVGHSG